MNETIMIISAFPCTGKTWVVENASKEGWKAVDSDSSLFSWESKGVRHRDWPSNYMEHIRQKVASYNLVLVSSHAEVRKALGAHGLRFLLAYPRYDLMDEYQNRAAERGSPGAFVSMIGDNWDTWQDELNAQTGCDKIILGPGEYLADVL